MLLIIHNVYMKDTHSQEIKKLMADKFDSNDYMKCAIKICPSAEFLLRNAILLVFIIIHKSIQAFVYFCQLLHVSIRTTYFV